MQNFGNIISRDLKNAKGSLAIIIVNFKMTRNALSLETENKIL